MSRATFSGRATASLLGLGLLGSCFSTSVVEGLPCSSDETCGPDHACAFGYCRPAGYDALAACGDGQHAQGEFCYPDDAVVEVAFTGALRETAWADFDGNGFVDALTISETASLNLNQGDRTFGRNDVEVDFTFDDARALGFEIPDAFPDFTPTIIPRHVAVGNFAGSDLPDAVLALQFGGGPDSPVVQGVLSALSEPLWLAENLGEGEVLVRVLPQTAPTGALPLLTFGLQSGDFNGDGRDDVVAVAGAFMSGIRADVHFGDPDLELGAPVAIPLGGAGVPRIGDFNGDGVDDLATPDNEMRTVAVVLGPFDGQAEPIPEIFGVDGSPLALQLADLDEDGNLDILVLFEGDEAGFQPFFGDGSGDEFEAGDAVRAEGITFASTGDLDADGNLDVVSVSNAGLLVHPGYGDGSFGGGFSLDDDPAAFVEVFRLDGDDVPDIVIGSPNVAALLYGEP